MQFCNFSYVVNGSTSFDDLKDDARAQDTLTILLLNIAFYNKYELEYFCTNSRKRQLSIIPGKACMQRPLSVDQFSSSGLGAGKSVNTPDFSAAFARCFDQEGRALGDGLLSMTTSRNIDRDKILDLIRCVQLNKQARCGVAPMRCRPHAETFFVMDAPTPQAPGWLLLGDSNTYAGEISHCSRFGKKQACLRVKAVCRYLV